MNSLISLDSSELSLIAEVVKDHCKALPSTWVSWSNSIVLSINSVIENSPKAEVYDVTFTLSKDNWQEAVEILESEKNNYDEKSKSEINKVLMKIGGSVKQLPNEIPEEAKIEKESEDPQIEIDEEKKVLWSGLIKSNKRLGIFCPQELKVTIDDFYQELLNQIGNDRIPAKAELCDINWDNTSISQKRIIVSYAGDEIKPDENVVQFLIGVDDFGNYSYIEKKIIIKKPKLPPFPEKKDHMDRPQGNCASYFFLYLLGIIPGLVYSIIIGDEQAAYDENAEKEDKQYEKQKKAWDKSWDDWENNVFKVAYLNSTNDIFGRFTETISILVNVVIKTLFEDRKAEIRERTEEAFTQEQLKAEMEKRRKEFK